MDAERAANQASNPSFVDRARDDALRSGVRASAASRAVTKVHRHRAGVDVAARVVGTGAEEEEEEEEVDALGFERRRRAAESRARDDAPDTARVAQQRRHRDSSSDSDASSESESEDEAARDARRAAIRARAAAREAELERGDFAEDDDDVDEAGAVHARASAGRSAEAPDAGNASSSSYETDSEYETDSDDSDAAGACGSRKLFKPIFVRASERDTIEERDRINAELEAEAEKNAEAKAAKKAESKKLVELEVRREEELARALDEMEPSDVDTEDEFDDSGAFDAWKERELERLKTDRIQRELMYREREEQERIRNMTEEERDLYHAKRIAKQKANEKDKPKMAFMQKYYHKGAFFQESADDAFGTAGPDEIYKRDFTAPTELERGDKTLLPAAMQVRKGTFGMRGNTKWTHLANEDTSIRKDETDDLWSGKNRDVRALKAKVTEKQAGMKKI